MFASSKAAELTEGGGCLGGTTIDPLGETFSEIYNASFYYVVWNDQSYEHPKISGCSNSCGAPWGHSKGIIAWNDTGEGLVLQVTTPSWPESGSSRFPRAVEANTLGCTTDNNVKLSQHFFALKLSASDTRSVLEALANASVVTKPGDSTVFHIGGPEEIQNAANTLGKTSSSKTVKTYKLSHGVILISKPSRLNVPPWQMVSAVLGGISLKAATFWNSHDIPDTEADSRPACWDRSLGVPGAVRIVHKGQWGGQSFSFESGSNHAKIGVSTDPGTHYTIFGDMNQEGTLEPNGAQQCAHKQNPRGGLFFVLDDPVLFAGVSALLSDSQGTVEKNGAKKGRTRKK